MKQMPRPIVYPTGKVGFGVPQRPSHQYRILHRLGLASAYLRSSCEVGLVTKNATSGLLKGDGSSMSELNPIDVFCSVPIRRTESTQYERLLRLLRVRVGVMWVRA